MKNSVILFALLISNFAFAWGGRGHDTICESATQLVENKELKRFLVTRTHIMGHLCNVPDISWKSTGESRKEGDPAHYIDSEVLPMPVKDIPLDLSKIISDFNGKKRANRDDVLKSVPHDMGTLWWRADQFYRRAVAEKGNFEKAALPDKKQEQEETNEFNKAVYNFFVNLGIMGHFVGDASQPFHSTDDFDGYAKGHGGIHSYYEEAAVAMLDENLQAKIVKEARKLLANSKKEKFLADASVLEKMRSLTVLSFADVDAVLKADLLKKPSEVKEERGMKLRTPAERESLDKTMKKFEPLIIKHMARSAALLAQFWDHAYVDAGKPALQGYRSFKYPFQPDFVMPDYYEIKKPQ